MELSISNANLKNPTAISSFTEGQRKAYIELIDWINAAYNPNDNKRALIGPAGTGKTYLAMAMAITAFKKDEVNRIIDEQEKK